MKYENILILNFYLFKKKNFFNKIIYDKIIKNSYLKNNLINYYNYLKISLIYYNPFYGVNIISYFSKIKINLIKKYKLKLENTVLLYRKFKKYKIPYKELSYIFNLSIEKIRTKYV